MMEILYVFTQRPWPLNVGSRIRAFNTLKGLARNHDVSIALATDDPNEAQQPADEGWPGWQIHRLTREQPSFMQSLPSRLWARCRMVMAPAHRDLCRRSLMELISGLQPDVVWYYQSTALWMAGHSPDFPCVYDMDDLESRKYSRQARYEPLARRLVIAADRVPFATDERSVLTRPEVVLISNPDDKSMVERRTAASVMAVPNGFDFPELVDIRMREGKRIVFFGCMTYGPCADGIAWFCREVWPLIIRGMPDARLDIAGSYPPDLGWMGSLPGVKMHGFVLDLQPLIDDAAFLVVPLRVAGGTRIKILEAWSKGLPVVTTAIGCEGLAALDGTHLLMGNTPESFADRCLTLLSSPQMGTQLAARAFEHGKQRFDWNGLYPILEQALEVAVERHGGTTSPGAIPGWQPQR